MRRMSQEGRGEPVDAMSMPDWEADTASQAGTWFLFWCWYVPAEALHPRRRLRAMGAAARRVRAVLRYPMYTVTRSVAAKMPVRR